MSTRIIKGKLQHYDVTTKYDDNGDPYQRYFVIVNGEKLTTKTHKSINFAEGKEVILNVNEGNEIIGGVIPTNGERWGKTTGLKGQVKPNSEYELVEGTVLEKRKEVFNRPHGTGSTAKDMDRTTVTYTIVLGDQNLRVEEHIGKKIKHGDSIAVAVFDGWILALKNTATNKVYGSAQPTYILFLILLIVFNVVLQVYKDAVVANFNALLIIGNIIFALLTFATFRAYRGRNAAKKFLLDTGK